MAPDDISAKRLRRHIEQLAAADFVVPLGAEFCDHQIAGLHEGMKGVIHYNVLDLGTSSDGASPSAV